MPIGYVSHRQKCYICPLGSDEQCFSPHLLHMFRRVCWHTVQFVKSFHYEIPICVAD